MEAAMPSPFPGMDPYLEDPANWPDFHSTFIPCAREAIKSVLPPHYTARIGERVYLIADEPPGRRKIEPDLAVERLPGSREAFIEILHRSDRSLVTAFELLSPSNKELPGRALYLAKRNGLIIRDVNIFELDLLIGGQRLPLREDVELPAGDYHAFISRGDRRPDCDVYSWNLPDRLPVLPIPLRAPDPDVPFDLAAVFALVYERGTYADEIDYARPPSISLSDERLKWAASVTASRPAGG
jgi:hypothetical protein